MQSTGNLDSKVTLLLEHANCLLYWDKGNRIVKLSCKWGMLKVFGKKENLAMSREVTPAEGKRHKEPEVFVQ